MRYGYRNHGCGVAPALGPLGVATAGQATTDDRGSSPKANAATAPPHVPTCQALTNTTRGCTRARRGRGRRGYGRANVKLRRPHPAHPLDRRRAPSKVPAVAVAPAATARSERDGPLRQAFARAQVPCSAWRGKSVLGREGMGQGERVKTSKTRARLYSIEQDEQRRRDHHTT